jgi:hypothetical protein
LKALANSINTVSGKANGQGRSWSCGKAIN